MRKPVKEHKSVTGLAFLVESELEKAQVVIAAQSILDKMQKMAEDLAKIEADDIMPMLDSMRLTFGPELTDSFNDITTAKIRQTMEAVKGAKEAITTEVGRLERNINGEMTNDMGMDTPDIGDDETDMDLGDEETDMDLGDEETDMDLEEPEEDGVDFDTAFDTAANSSAAGRARKESVERNIKALSESSNPDRLIYATFRRTLTETKDAVRSAHAVASAFAIDLQDVVSIVKESSKKDPDGRRKNNDHSEARNSKKRERPSDLDEALETERVKHPIGQRPKGPGWTLKSAGEQTGKDHNVWERKFKRVGGVKEEADLDEALEPWHRDPHATDFDKPSYQLKAEHEKREAEKIKNVKDSLGGGQTVRTAVGPNTMIGGTRSMVGVTEGLSPAQFRELEAKRQASDDNRKKLGLDHERKTVYDWLNDPKLDTQVVSLQVGKYIPTDKAKGIVGYRAASYGDDNYTNFTNPMYFKPILKSIADKFGPDTMIGGTRSMVGVTEGKKASAKAPAKGKKPDYPDVDGDGNTKEPMKKAAAQAKPGTKGVNPFANKKKKAVKESAAAGYAPSMHDKIKNATPEELWNLGLKLGGDGIRAGQELKDLITAQAELRGVDRNEIQKLFPTRIDPIKFGTQPAKKPGMIDRIKKGFKTGGVAEGERDATATTRGSSIVDTLEGMIDAFNTIEEAKSSAGAVKLVMAKKTKQKPFKVSNPKITK